MTNDQVRKLLGGYATNSLTEAERKALFEAALEDQELFDALGHEQALKELLADPASRNQIQLALAEPPVASSRRAAWWSRGWAWGSLAGAMAAAVLIFAVVRSQPKRTYQAAVVERRAAPPAQLEAPAAKPPPPSSNAPAPKPSTRRLAETPLRTKEADAAPPPPPPPARAPVPQALPFRFPEPIRQQAGAAQVQEQLQTQAGAQVQDREQAVQRFRARTESAATSGNIAGFLANYSGPLLRYSLVKGDASGIFSPFAAGAALNTGDGVRIAVTSGIAGSLSLQQLGADGQWRRVFPQTGEGVEVTANVPQTIPDSPVIAQDTEQRFRLMLIPAGQQAGQAGASSTVAATPLTTDITIPAGKRP